MRSPIQGTRYNSEGSKAAPGDELLTVHPLRGVPQLIVDRVEPVWFAFQCNLGNSGRNCWTKRPKSVVFQHCQQCVLSRSVS
jgi:hypothetical protein